jgi:hypothetical protein
MAATGVGSAVVGSGSDLSEEPIVGLKSVALDSVVAPVCPPGPAARRFASLTICR